MDSRDFRQPGHSLRQTGRPNGRRPSSSLEQSTLSQFLERTGSGTLIETTNRSGPGDRVRDHPVHPGRRPRPVLELERNDLAFRHPWRLAGRQPRRVDRSRHLPRDDDGLRQGPSRQRVAAHHLDVALCPAVADGARHSEDLGRRRQRRHGARCRRMGPFRRGQGVGPERSKGQQICPQRRRRVHGQRGRCAVSICKALHRDAQRR